MESSEEKFKLLLIDDEEGIVFAFQSVFSHLKSIEFFVADKALKGIEIAKREKPQVISLDLRMPGMNGEEALKELKEILPETKFIIMTGWEDPVTRQRIESMGVEAFYLKPIDLEKVMTKIMNLLMIK